MKDAFGATLLEPLVSRAFELRLKLALKAADAHVRQGCKILNVADPFIIFVDEILEMGAISYDVVQKSVQLLRSMITAKKDAELLLLDLMKWMQLRPSSRALDNTQKKSATCCFT